MKKIFNFFNRFSFIKLFVILTFFSVGLSFIFTYLSTIIDIEFDVKNDLDNAGFFKIFAYAVILAPVIETLLFSYIPFKIFSYFNISYKYFIFIASFLFALTHYYSLVYIFYAFFSGLIFNYYYIYLSKYYKKAFLWVVLLHAASNFILIIIEQIFG